MAKIVGFTKVANKANGFKTRAGFMSSEVFIAACTKAGEILDISYTDLMTKRQASSFSRKKGIVYKTLYGEGAGEE